MNTNTKITSISSMLLMVVGLLLYLFIHPNVGIYTFAAGALILGFQRFVVLIRSRQTDDITRLPQIHLFSVAALLGAAYLMYDGSNSWSVLLLVSAVIELYVSYRQK